MTTKRTMKKTPAKPGVDILDGIDRAKEAQEVGRLFEVLPEEQLPGLYRRLHALALSHLEPVDSTRELLESGGLMRLDRKALYDTLTPSQQSAFQMLEAADDLLAAGAPTTDHARQWRASRQRSLTNWMGRLNASDVALGKSRRIALAGFGKSRGSDQTQERELVWSNWQAMAEQIAKERPDIADNISQVARVVKARTNASESFETIRKRLEKTW